MDSSILLVLAVLAVTVFFLVVDVVRIDVVAIVCMLALGWTGVLSPKEVFSGFSSNAVMAMMGVMILGQGIAGTGIMDLFYAAVIRKAGTDRKKIIGLMSLSVGLLSGFVQNIGAAALFLPGILNISRREKIPPSALIMPIGFAAILGGTLTMIGSGPLILINDLIRDFGLEPYTFFSVTPVGVLLLIAGTSYFLVFGKYILPGQDPGEVPLSVQDRIIEAFHLPHHIGHYRIPGGSTLASTTTEESGVWDRYRVNVLGISEGREAEYAPWRETIFQVGQELALLGKEEDVAAFASDHGLIPVDEPGRFKGLNDPVRAGFAEVIIPPRSEMLGKSIRQFSLRKRYAVEPVMLFSKGEEIRGDLSDHQILPGDILIVHGLWEKISALKNETDFVVATPFVAETKVRTRTWAALACFLGAITLVLTGAPISLAFFTGAAAMVLVGVLSIQEAYNAIEWKVVFLLGGLIPLGTAMQKTGAAAFMAEKLMALVQGGHPLLMVLTVSLLSTVFSLLMSNVGAIMVLAPLVMNMGFMVGMDPRPLALLAAVCAANSFLLPTHQVNAFLMSSGGYRNADYLKAGGGMTLIFLLVAVAAFQIFYF